MLNYSIMAKSFEFSEKTDKPQLKINNTTAMKKLIKAE